MHLHAQTLSLSLSLSLSSFLSTALSYHGLKVCVNNLISWQISHSCNNVTVFFENRDLDNHSVAKLGFSSYSFSWEFPRLGVTSGILLFTYNAGNIFIEGKLTRTNTTFLDKFGMFEVMQKYNVETLSISRLL